MPNQRRSRPVRRSSGSGDVFVPVIIILVGIYDFVPAHRLCLAEMAG